MSSKSFSTKDGKLLNSQQAALYSGVGIETIRLQSQTGKPKGKKASSISVRSTHKQLDRMVRPMDDKYDTIKHFLLNNAIRIEKVAVEKHRAHLRSVNYPGKILGKNQIQYFEIIKLLAYNLEDETRGKHEFNKISNTFAQNLLDQGLTIVQVLGTMKYLKRAIWETMEVDNLFQGMSANDLYSLNRTLNTYKDILTNQMSLVFQEHYDETQKELRQSKDVFAKTFHSSPVAMTIVRASDGVFIDANENYFKLMGCKKSDAIGRNFADFNRKKHYGFVEPIGRLSAIKYSNERINFDAEIKTKTGDIKQIRGAYVAVMINGEKHIITSHADVTDRLKSEETNRYLATLTNNISDAVIGLDINHNIVTWNKGAQKIYGWKAKEVVGKSLTGLLRTKLHDKSLNLTEVRRILAEKGFWSGESTHHKKDGSPVAILSSLAAIKDEKGDLVGSVSVYHDISKRKQAETSLMLRESRYRILFNSIVAGFCVLEMVDDEQGNAYDFRYIESNSAFKEIARLEKPEGKTIRQSFSSTPEGWIDRLAKVIATGKDNRTTEYFESSNTWYDVHMMRVGGKSSRLVTLLIRDVTKARTIEEERAASAKKIINTLESIDEAFFQIDADSNIMVVNEAFVSMTRLPRKMLLGLNLWDLFSYKNQPDEIYRKTYMHVMEAQQPAHFVDHFAEQQLWLDIRAYPVAEGGMLAFIKDITQQKMAEEKQELLAKLSAEHEELIKIGHAKDEFIGIASHQLRTPATGVKQYVGMLLDGFGGSITETQRKYLETAYDSNERQIRLINDLLKTAQIDADSYTLRKSYQNIGSLLRNSVTTLRPNFKQKQQKVVVKDLSKDTEINVDPIELDLVFLNLLENASKYSPEKTTITVTLRRDEDYLQISVADNGFGIGKADQDRIFDKFTRANNMQSSEVSGTGFGLYWVRQIIELHGGKVTVSSKLHEGSIFTVTLPLR